MSIKLMTMVFDRYPEGGNERLLALALADHAKDDGTRIWPSVGELARKTLQHRSTVQRLIARMVERGWLEVVHKATGRPGDTNEYRINQAWVEGGELPETGSNLRPVSDDSGAPEGEPDAVDNLSTRVANSGERGRISSERGSTAMRPESSGTIIEPIPPKPPVETGGCGEQAQDSPADPAGRRKPVGPKDRAAWRWADKRSTIEARAEALGLEPWNHARWVAGEGPDFQTFKARVFATHLVLLGVSITPHEVMKAMAADKANNHTALLRRLAGHNEEQP